ncbi:MAG: hypothetical protein LJE96_12870 [Deltaproteobacteria bacterium]|nr:hypothetical protein [Deltaproteobacteria bacterium]
MHCRNHPNREAVIPCQKHLTGYCSECLENGISCTDPSIYCKFRPQCVIWELGRKDRKKALFEEDVESVQVAV